MSSNIKYFYHKTVAGNIKVLFTEHGINCAEFVKEENIDFSNTIDLTKINLVGTEFQIKVWKATLKIPVGKITTYQEIANEIGSPNSHRAVANALASNKIAYFIPCHRVIRKDGTLAGYKWGIEKKISLLQDENAI